VEKVERFQVVFEATREVFKPSLVSVIVVALVNIPIFTLTGVEGKMFHPMAFTVVVALLGALILTFVPAAVALFVTGRIQEKENRAMQWARKIYRPALAFVLQNRAPTVAAAVVVVALSALLAARMGAEFIPSLNEGDLPCTPCAFPAPAYPGRDAASAETDQGFPRGTGSSPRSARRKSPPTRCRPRGRQLSCSSPSPVARPEAPQGRTGRPCEAERILAITTNSTQPIQMRFNELISGALRRGGSVRRRPGRVAGKREEIAEVLEKIPGAADVKVEQLTGLPMLTVKIDRQKVSRYGINVSEVQEVVEVAVGGKEAGRVFEGDALRPAGAAARAPARGHGRLKRLPIRCPGQDQDGGEAQPSGPWGGGSSSWRPALTR
jgi:cobalt-zinc-cadmium resistance protein CzcA